MDSGAGVRVWPKTWKEEVRMMPKKEGLRMVAANGTEIKNLGQKLIRFQGQEYTARAHEEGAARRRLSGEGPEREVHEGGAARRYLAGRARDSGDFTWRS